MKYIKFTYVDAVTGIAVTEAPAENGPKFPAIDGLEFAWARESRYPTGAPEFFGTCPDDADISVPGVLGEYLMADWEGMRDDEMLARKPAASSIDVERDRRIDAGFDFEGVRYQSRPTDRENIAGAVLVAMADPSYTTSWIASDNSVVQMDAATLLRFGRAAADRKQALIFAGRQLKDMQPIPADYTADKWWP